MILVLDPGQFETNVIKDTGIIDETEDWTTSATILTHSDFNNYRIVLWLRRVCLCA